MDINIFNRPPSISEDTLIYAIYPVSYSQKGRITSTTDKSSALSLTALIEDHIKHLLTSSSSATVTRPRPFIWHKDAFELRVVRQDNESEGDAEGWFLEGRMRVGDCVDDEWCAVWLLREVSKRWDVAISVYDSDGEFLLIEAADYLPTWVKPGNAENRVWLYQSHLHLIPLEQSSSSNKRKKSRRRGGYDSDNENNEFEDAADDEQYISEHDALSVLADPSVETRAPEGVERAVWGRIEGYPDALREHVHIARAYLPVDIAKALAQEPALVQRAVEAFYTRDAVQLRAAQRMTRFPPHPSSMVLSTLAMTRTAYAQLVGQRFHPPKVFNAAFGSEFKMGTQEWKSRDVGMKIACGFEMLWQEDKTRTSVRESVGNREASIAAKKDALQRTPAYVKYIDNLEKAGYFQGELRGSEKWEHLEGRAVEVYVDSGREDDTSSSRPSFASIVNAAIARAGDGDLPSPGEEESDSWLEVDEGALERRLEGSASAKSVRTSEPSQKEDRGDRMDVDEGKIKEEDDEDKAVQDQAGKLKDLAKKVKSFVEGEGAMEGAVFDDDMLSDEDEGEPMEDFSEEESSSESDNEEQIDAARRAAMDKLVPGIAPEEYGKMPATFYANSQRVRREEGEDEDIEDNEDDKEKKKDTSTSIEQEQSLSRPIRRSLLPRDNFDGVDSDDETDSEEESLNRAGLRGTAIHRPNLGEDEDDEDNEPYDEDEDEEDHPQIVGDVEIDMAEEEEEFIAFTREVLGISEEMWGDIVKERRGRGAFLPESTRGMTFEDGPKPSKEKEVSNKNGKASPSIGSRGKGQKQLQVEEEVEEKNTGPNKKLDSFEAVMKAMDLELARTRAERHLEREKSTSKPGSNLTMGGKEAKGKGERGKGKAKADSGLPTLQEDGNEDAEMDIDIENAMDAELRSTLMRDEDEEDDGDDENANEDGTAADYALIRNFLESFNSQAGMAGPVSTLAGRLRPGFRMPRGDT